jgi:hypothetical protein
MFYGILTGATKRRYVETRVNRKDSFGCRLIKKAASGSPWRRIYTLVCMEVYMFKARFRGVQIRVGPRL